MQQQMLREDITMKQQLRIQQLVEQNNDSQQIICRLRAEAMAAKQMIQSLVIQKRQRFDELEAQKQSIQQQIRVENAVQISALQQQITQKDTEAVAQQNQIQQLMQDLDRQRRAETSRVQKLMDQYALSIKEKDQTINSLQKRISLRSDVDVEDITEQLDESLKINRQKSEQIRFLLVQIQKLKDELNVVVPVSFTDSPPKFSYSPPRPPAQQQSVQKPAVDGLRARIAAAAECFQRRPVARK